MVLKVSKKTEPEWVHKNAKGRTQETEGKNMNSVESSDTVESQREHGHGNNGHSRPHNLNTLGCAVSKLGQTSATLLEAEQERKCHHCTENQRQM